MHLLKLILKSKLKRLYIRIQTYDNYNCGHAMQLMVDTSYFNLCKKFNKVADKLSKIDKDCPSFRYNLNP